MSKADGWIDHGHAPDEGREGEERFRHLVESWAQATWEADADGLVAADSRSWRGYTGQTLREYLGEGWAGAVHPEDRAEVLRRWRRAVASGQPFDMAFRLRRVGGSWRWTNARATPLRGPDGAIRKWVGMNIDIEEHRATRDALREGEERLSTLMQGLPQLIWRGVSDGRWTWCGPQWTAYTGQACADGLGLGWLAAVHPEDRERVRRDWEVVEARFVSEYRIRDAAGRHRWFQTRAAPRRDAQGRVVEWLGASTDVDDLHRLQAEQAVLVAELQHRTRNLITVTRSIARETARESPTLEAFGHAFNDRLTALSRVQGLLSQPNHESITLHALLALEFEALGAAEGGRIALEGPEVALCRTAAQTLALALHELATNARKYGALAAETGQLSVRWTVREDGGPRLALEWREMGAAATGAPRGGGYGRKLIEQALPYALDARTRYELDAEGVRCAIDLPLSGHGSEAGRFRT